MAMFIKFEKKRHYLWVLSLRMTEFSMDKRNVKIFCDEFMKVSYLFLENLTSLAQVFINNEIEKLLNSADVCRIEIYQVLKIYLEPSRFPNLSRSVRTCLESFEIPLFFVTITSNHSETSPDDQACRKTNDDILPL